MKMILPYFSKDKETLLQTDACKKRSSVPDNLKDYLNYRDKLTVEDGILLKNHKLPVPKNLHLVI